MSRLFRRHPSQRASYIEPVAEKFDIYDGFPWTEMDVEDLTAALKHGSTIEDAAHHLCRSGTIDDVQRKLKSLGCLR